MNANFVFAFGKLMDKATKSSTHIQHRHIAMLICPNCLSVDAISPLEVFNFANITLQLMGQLSLEELVYKVSLVAEKMGVVKTSSVVCLFADLAFDDDFEDLDILMVAGEAHVAYIESARKDTKRGNG